MTDEYIRAAALNLLRQRAEERVADYEAVMAHVWTTEGDAEAIGAVMVELVKNITEKEG